MPLTQEELDAANGMFSPAPIPEPGMSIAATPAPPVQDVYGQAQQAFARPMTPPSAASPLSDDAYARASGAFVKRKPTTAEDVAAALVPAALPTSPASGGLGKLAADVARDRKSLIGTYDEEKKATEQIGREQSAKGALLADEYGAQSRRAEKDAAIQREAYRQAQEEHAKYMQGTNDLIREVASERVDPHAFFTDEKGKLNFTVAIGALLMGAAGGLASQDGRNHGLEALNAMIDRDISVQEKNIAGKRSTIQQRQSVYAQMREELGDKMLADDKFRIGALEAAKNRVQAFSAGSDSKIDAARTAAAIGAIDKEQKQVVLSYSERAQQLAQQAAAQAASHKAAEAQRQFENTLKVGELGIKQQSANTEAVKAQSEAGKADKSQQEKDASIRETNSQFDHMMRAPLLDKLGNTTAALSHLGQRIAPESSKTDVEVRELNTRILAGLGAYAKDADGKPNKTMIDEYKAAYEIHPSDTKPIALTKIQGARKFVNALARKQGDNAPDPDIETTVGFTPGLK